MASRPPRAPLSWLLLPLVTGYILAPALPNAPWMLASIGSILACAAAGFAWINSRWSARVWPFLAFTAASLLAGSYMQHRTEPPPGWENLPPREAELTLKIDRLFNSGADRTHGLATVTKTDSHLTDLLDQTVYFSINTTTGGNEWIAGTRLSARGILESITSNMADENPFLKHLLSAGVHFQYRRLVLTDDPLPNEGLSAFCARERDRLESFLRRGSTEDMSIVNVFVAMLLGKRGELDADQKTAFLQTGTFHLFAISGLHIGIIAFALHSLLAVLRVPEKPSVAIGLSLLLCFVGITGAAPSAVRAFLMVLFFWGARFLSRAPNPVAALANSAIFVLLIFPHQLASPGFQLSYSVVAGILFLGLPLSRHLEKKWTPFSGLPPDSLNRFQRRAAYIANRTTGLFAISLAATLVSSPLSIHYFELFTPGGIFLNLLLIPAAGLVLVSGFISVILSFTGLGVFGIVFNHAGWLLLTVMEKIVTTSAAIPALFWQARFVSPWQGPLLLSALLACLLLCAHREWKAPFFHFVTPFLLFTAWLLIAARLTFLGQ